MEDEISRRARAATTRSCSTHIVPRLGGRRLRDVTVAVIDDFKAKPLAAGVGDSQTRQALAVLSGMFTYAEQGGRVSRNPVRLVRKPSSKRKRAVVCLSPLTVELARAVLLENQLYGDAALIVLLAYAGPRPQDALALEWTPVRERTLLVEQKNVDGEIVAGQKTSPRLPELQGRPLERDRLGELDGTRVGGRCARSWGDRAPTGCGTPTRLCEYTRARPSPS